jgi:hypothetical protein
MRQDVWNELVGLGNIIDRMQEPTQETHREADGG